VPRPQPALVYHFTRLEHLAGVVTHGLLSDNNAQAAGLLSVEIGNTGIKEDRRRRVVPIPPGGHVADYAPFYFATRSPMMFAIEKGNVPTYQDGSDRLVYLVSSLERLTEYGLPVLLTDRNAVLSYTEFINLADGLEDDFIDWPLMRATYWFDTAAQPDRRERRMAECLVYERVPWDAILGVAAKTQAVADEATSIMRDLAQPSQARVRRNWYF
jgi:hypothetical protein